MSNDFFIIYLFLLFDLLFKKVPAIKGYGLYVVYSVKNVLYFDRVNHI